MKTKKQIREWLDRQPWKNEFYEEFFKDDNRQLCWNDGLIMNAFNWHNLAHRELTWTPRNKEYIDWYNSTDRPMSWEAYCEQNPITKGDWCIEDGEVCELFDPILSTTEQERDPTTGIDVMSKDHCEAFLAYMKLFQLRNAWVKDENLDDLSVTYKILYQDGMFNVFKGHTSTGLSFSNKEEAKEFMETFGNLLKMAKPLL